MIINFHAIMTNPYVFLELVVFIALITTLFIKFKEKIFDFDDEEIKEEIHHDDKNYEEEYRKGA